MKKESTLRTVFIFGIILVLCSTMCLPVLQAEDRNEVPLPPPIVVDMILEQSMFRRMSVRDFTNESVSDEELSTVLWAAYGYQTDGGRTIAAFNGTYAGIIYVLKQDAAYTYNPENHSLVFFKAGDWRDIVGWQYEAPIQLCLCWDTTLADSHEGGAQLGEIGQNIQFMANALDLGTVVCGQTPPAIDPLGIPEDQEGVIVMPLGHLMYPYNFKDRPLWLSLLPKAQQSTMSLSAALNERTEAATFNGTLTRADVGQLIWSTYGFSPYLDKSDQLNNIVKRHRSVPSAHGYYPLVMYAVTQDGIYRYQPNLFVKFNNYPVDFLGLPILTYLIKMKSGDYRIDIADASTQPTIASAPLILLSVLDVEKTRPAGNDDLSSELNRRFWFFEAGASAYNVLLESTSFGYDSAIVQPTNKASLRAVLGLNEDYDPFYIIPVGA